MRARRSGRVLRTCCLLAVGLSLPAWAQVDLAITEIRFSNETPQEGDAVTLTAVVTNLGPDALTDNYDVDVWFFEDDPAQGALQIQARESVPGLGVGEKDVIRAQFRPRAGRWNIHAIANPEPEAAGYREDNSDNNEATRLLVATPREFPRATPAEIQGSIDRAVHWVRSQQGELVVKCPQDGMENPAIVPACVICSLSLSGLPINKKPSPAWSPTEGGPAATSLALLTLMGAGVDPSDPAIVSAFEYLWARDWNIFDVYDLSVIILALVATGDHDRYFDRVQFSTDRLVEKQLRTDNGGDPRDDGGWGYSLTGDGAHMQYATYALYTAKQWGVEIDPVAWKKAERWVRSTQHTAGGWNYNLIESPWAEGPYGSMTGTGLMALKMMGVPITDPDFQRGMEWLDARYTVTSNPGSFHWHYYFLLSVQRAMDTPPVQDTVARHRWFDDMADVFVATQHPDGRWQETDGEKFAATCFGILFLRRYVPQPIAPDLSVVPGSLRLTPTSPAVGERVAAQFTLASLGSPLADSLVDVAVYRGHPEDGGVEVATTQVMFSETRSDATATVSWQAAYAGEHEMYVAADPHGAVTELDEANNVGGVSLTVAEKGAGVTERAPQMRQIAPRVVAFGEEGREVIVDQNLRELRMSGKVLAASRIIEYLATTPLGKVHETILALDAEPLHLQVAMLGLGLEYENNLRHQGDPRTPRGDPVEIWVEWERNGATERRRAEELVYNDDAGRVMAQTPWVFTGSRMQGSLFMAEATQSLIATYRDHDAILNHPLASGTGQGLRANLAVLPPKGTPVTVTIRPL
ncbi:hypothetical protein HN371_14160 [Candidatus Poribacteria bacterium]|jgi:hypothetical protein|nr:hypothetical protein [Candidatus Poribacteria bacterium]MBT5534926.1 hypothetical protein [Candidatus Poribacteria bacterium]MBT7099675.1 hypothetical protein [Candidatus Poribacteria bacterium]MBT7806128.1 hypothetical protein [Candidatus Poribacteria bacterium]